MIVDLAVISDSDLNILYVDIMNEMAARQKLHTVPAQIDNLMLEYREAKDRNLDPDVIPPWTADELYPIGYKVTYTNGKTYTCRQAHRSQSDWHPDIVPALWSVVATVPPVGQDPTWEPNVAYAVNTIVTWKTKKYKCLQPHTSQVGWDPDLVPALWQLI
jgi:hypothetical protein